jgi:hypothetical protein
MAVISWRKPECVEKTRIPGENQNIWRKPEYLVKTIIPGENQNT